MSRKFLNARSRLRPGLVTLGAWVALGLHSAHAAPAVAPDAHCSQQTAGLPLANAGTLTMSVNATLPPTMYVDASGALAGMNIDMGNEIAKRLCLRAAYVNVAFEAQIPGLYNHRWDMINTGLYFTVARTHSMQLIPYSVGTLAVIAAQGGSHKIVSIADLSGRAVGVEIGGVEEQKLREMNADALKNRRAPIDIRVFNNYGDAFQALAATQIDAVFAGTEVGKYYSQRGRFQIAVDQLYPGSPAALATSEPKIAAAVVAALSAMAADGTYQRLITQYGVTTIDHWKEYPGRIQYFYNP